MNYFGYETAAKRYELSRPYFHPLVIDKIQQALKLSEPVAHALDVACGTGQSTRALKQIAHQITATDLSAEMLAEAPADPAMTYLQSPSESLPLPDKTFDLITVSLAFHWFERDAFLSEASRVLQSNGWLIIYNNWFTGRMKDNDAFEVWFRNEYLIRYPTPARNNRPLTPHDTAPHGLRMFEHQTYTNEVTFSVEELAGYLMTQSNVIAAVERGAEREAEVFHWLTAEMSPLFNEKQAVFGFGGSIDYLQKG